MRSHLMSSAVKGLLYLTSQDDHVCNLDPAPTIYAEFESHPAIEFDTCYVYVRSTSTDRLIEFRYMYKLGGFSGSRDSRRLYPA